MAVLLLVDEDAELTRQALTLAQGLGPVEALAPGSLELPVERVHVAELPEAYAPGAWATAVEELIDRVSPSAVVAPGTQRGNEVLAHVAARRDLPFAANCVALLAQDSSGGASANGGDGAASGGGASASGGGSLDVIRVRWGGSLLEESRIHSPLPLLSVAPHAVPAAEGTGSPAVESFAPALGEADLAVQVTEHADEAAAGVSLAEAKVVVSGGRGVGSADGFGMLEELAGLLDAAVGCSRVVTMAGWRPHTDQVGQTGTKIAPDLYIACGISGATQHMAGCKGAKRILAINADREAPILASADYAVIGDMHEILPAISAAIRAARS
jgi:electron transfer flavoprotein alpha subunit